MINLNTSKIKETTSKFYESKKNSKRITLEDLRELKDLGITTEQFLEYFCQTSNALLHGSIFEITEGPLVSRRGKIYATDTPAVAIMRSLYSNECVNLFYPLKISQNTPFHLKIHTPADGKYIKKEIGFVYIITEVGFENNPEGSWQFIKNSTAVPFDFIVETTLEDFTYPVEVINDLDIKAAFD